MDIYKKKSTWKISLAILGIVIILVSLFYTNRLAGKLSDEEKTKIEIWLLAMEEINDFDDEDLENIDITLHNNILYSNTTIPVILVNNRDGIDAVRNFGLELEGNELYFKEEVRKLQAEGFEPIKGFAASVYYKESNILRQLRYFPFIQLLLIGSFILFGYLALNSARRGEQNRVWAGMAKETAHQLGTPISAIIAWVEHLKLIREDDEEVLEVAEELAKDVNRLDLVADRFSKIGSAPKLEPLNIYNEMDECRAYMQKRAPRKVSFDFPPPNSSNLSVNINKHLFDWVVENLLRNALDSMGGSGHISAKIYTDDKFVNIDLSDTGKGIPGSKFKTIFKPGYTTKSRGWGLGLSLAKRIIEDYHSGKIFVKKSEENKGTTFTIRLPKG
jgi:signal transduction histidine kinase